MSASSSNELSMSLSKILWLFWRLWRAVDSADDAFLLYTASILNWQ